MSRSSQRQRSTSQSKGTPVAQVYRGASQRFRNIQIIRRGYLRDSLSLRLPALPFFLILSTGLMLLGWSTRVLR